MSGRDHTTVAKKAEAEIDDLLDLWRRRPFVCSLIAFVAIGLAGWWTYDRVRGIPNLRHEIEEVTRDRDAKATQLAPFLALAQKTFPEEPRDKRLDLLVEKVDEILRRMDKVAKAAAPRRLSKPTAKALTSALSSFSSYSVELSGVAGDNESMALAKQLEGVFTEAAWNLEFGVAARMGGPSNGIEIHVRPGVPEDLARAFLPMLLELDSSPTLYFDASVPPKMVRLHVGSK